MGRPTAAEKLATARSQITRGTLCHWQQPFGRHYVVVLNLAWPPADDIVYFSIATSKVAKFSSFLDDQIIRVSPGTYGFLKLPTVFDLRNVYRANLAAIVQQPEFAIVGRLTANHLADVDDVLRQSETVEQDVLQKIVK